MNDVSTPSAATPAALSLGRIFSISRSVFALLGFGVALAVAVPQARDGVLNQFDAVAWRPVVSVAVVRGSDTIETGGPAAPAHELLTARADPGRPGDAARDDARPVAVVAQDDPRAAMQATLTEYIAKRYLVADEVVADIVRMAFRAAEAQAVDPLVVLAMVATESRYNPIAESIVGAKGLMQIIAKFHPEKLEGYGGEGALFEPEVNIRIGTQILREYLGRYGDLETALQVYAGAIDDEETRYARKVFSERALLQRALERSRREA